jgi:Short C-terminal domain
MFGSRRGRPSLIGAAARTAGRTAVVVGTANAMSRPRGGPAPTAPVAEAAAAPAAAGLSSEAIDRLKELAGLQAAGILTEAEFAEQKARILAG